MTEHARPVLWDLFCCAGGAGMGYHRAGFEVIGFDLHDQPHYPFRFVSGDAIAILEALASGDAGGLPAPDAIHASPPCQAFTAARSIRGNEHPNLIDPARRLLLELGLPYIIENVPGAPLVDPIMLCGASFGLRTYRHRLFEASFPLVAPPHVAHTARTAPMGRKVKDGEFMSVVGNFSGAELGREIMGMPWATRNELREAIPPSYTEFLGVQLRDHLSAA